MKANNLFLITAAVLITSCKKEEKINQNILDPYIQFSAEALDYVQLPLNKYFIYRDSANGFLDSVVVTYNTLEKRYSPVQYGGWVAIPSYYYQHFTLILRKISGTLNQSWFSAEAWSDKISYSLYSPNLDSGKLFLAEKDPVTNADKNPVFVFPVVPASYTNGIDDTIEIINILPSITIEGKKYSDVAMFMFTNGVDSANVFYFKSTYYWVKGTGIIKREMKTYNSIKTDLLVRNG